MGTIQDMMQHEVILDILATKVMGFKPRPQPEGWYVRDHFPFFWDPLNEWADAWQLLARLADLRCNIDFLNYKDGRRVVIVQGPDRYGEGEDRSCIRRALCLAAVQAFRKNQELYEERESNP